MASAEYVLTIDVLASRWELPTCLYRLDFLSRTDQYGAAIAYRSDGRNRLIVHHIYPLLRPALVWPLFLAFLVTASHEGYSEIDISRIPRSWAECCYESGLVENPGPIIPLPIKQFDETE